MLRGPHATAATQHMDATGAVALRQIAGLHQYTIENRICGWSLRHSWRKLLLNSVSLFIPQPSLPSAGSLVAEGGMLFAGCGCSVRKQFDCHAANLEYVERDVEEAARPVRHGSVGGAALFAF